jgi:outer membrane protein assembly factor BamA
VAVVHQSGLDAGFDAARSFARGSGGGSTAADIAAGLAAVRDDAVALGRYAVSVGVDSVVAAGPEDSVHVTVACGPPLMLEAIELSGATSTRPGSAASISGLRYGRPVTPAALDEARARLEASELFTTVGEPRVLPGSEPGRAKVVVPVEEARGSRFEGAIGVAREGGVTGLVDLALGNIGGTGRGAGARWAGLGDGRSEYRLHYREPALFGKPVTAGITLEAEIAESLFTQTRWSLGFGGRPAGGLAAGLALARSSSVYSGVSRGSSATWSVQGTAAWRGAHPKANPTRGMGLTLQGELGTRTETYPGMAEIGRSLGSFSGLWEAARPLGGSRVLYARVRGEQVTLSGDDIPADELRYVGGSEGLRGHRDRAFAGNRIFNATVEPRWLTDPAGGRLFLFLDVARHELGAPVAAGVPVDPAASASLARTTLSDGWEMGYGAGLRSRMASGLVGLELGLRPGAAVREATIHIRYASTW